MLTLISSLAGDVWPLICFYLTAYDICELQYTGYRPFLKILSYSNLCHMNLVRTNSTPFILPPYLSPIANLRSLILIHETYSSKSGWDALSIYQLPQSLTHLELEVPEPRTLFSAPNEDVVQDLQNQMDETFPVLSRLAITTSERYISGMKKGYEGVRLVLPSSVSHLRCSSRLVNPPKTWPENLTFLDISYTEVTVSWGLTLPSCLQGLICKRFPGDLISLLGSNYPFLKTFHQIDMISRLSSSSSVVPLETQLPRTLTSVNFQSLIWHHWSRFHTPPDLSNLPNQLIKINFGDIKLSKQSDVFMIPRTVTKMSFQICGISCLEAMPKGLTTLKYLQSSKPELGIGPLLPRGLTRLDLQLTRLADKEHRFLPSTLIKLSLCTLSNASVKHLADLKALRTLKIYGGKMSRKAYLRIPRSVTKLCMFRCSLQDADALQNSLPNLICFMFLADRRYELVCQPGVFSALPTSLQELFLWIGPSYSRFPCTLDLARLINLTKLDSIAAPYDASLNGLAALPSSLTHLSCHISWSLSTSEVVRLPQSIRFVKIKSIKRESIDTAAKKELERRAQFQSTWVKLRSHHPLFGFYK